MRAGVTEAVAARATRSGWRRERLGVDLNGDDLNPSDCHHVVGGAANVIDRIVSRQFPQLWDTDDRAATQRVERGNGGGAVIGT